jgi:hypothetical protein
MAAIFSQVKGCLCTDRLNRHINPITFDTYIPSEQITPAAYDMNHSITAIHVVTFLKNYESCDDI